MELFTITCTTCRQRLKVCDVATIGQIEICPKCGSMVLVEPPAGWTVAEGGEPPVASAEAPAPPPSEPAREAPPTDSAAHSPLAGAPLPPGPPGGPPLPPEHDPASLGDGVAEPAGIEPPPTPPQGGSAGPPEPLLPTEDWTSQAARQRQQWLMLGGAAFAGVVLALGLVGWLASRAVRRTEEIVAAPDAVAESPPLAASPSDAAPPPKPDVPPDESAATADTPRPAPAKPPPTATADTGAAAVPAPAADPSVAPAEPAPPDPAPQPDGAPPESPPTPPAAPPEKPADAGPSKETNLDPGALSETLNAFAPFLDPPMDSGPPQPMDTAPPEVPQLDPQTRPSDQPSAPRPEPRPVDVAARLQDKMAEVQFADVPLKNFLRFIMNFSTIPVSMDPDALALVRATPRSTVHVHLADATVDQLLGTALAPLQLAHLTVDQQLVVTRPPLADGQLRTYTLGVGDLVGSDPQALRQLADLIVEFVEPAAWEAAGGAGVIREESPSLVIQQQETILFRAIVFCDRLRVARGLPPQSKFDPALFSLEPRWVQAAPRLAQPVTLNFPQPASFTRILDRLSDEGGVEILIDWPALVQLGWTPDTETTVAAHQRPVGDVLTDMLGPMELTYRVLDASAIQVTSPAAAQARWDIEFYPLAESAGQTPDALVTQVRNDLTGGQPETLAGALHFDPPSRRLIAALPQSAQRKLAELRRP